MIEKFPFNLFQKINNSEKKKISSEAIHVFIVFLVKLLKLKNSSFLKNLTILGKKKKANSRIGICIHEFLLSFDKITKTLAYKYDELFSKT